MSPISGPSYSLLGPSLALFVSAFLDSGAAKRCCDSNNVTEALCWPLGKNDLRHGTDVPTPSGVSRGGLGPWKQFGLWSKTAQLLGVCGERLRARMFRPLRRNGSVTARAVAAMHRAIMHWRAPLPHMFALSKFCFCFVPTRFDIRPFPSLLLVPNTPLVLSPPLSFRTPRVRAGTFTYRR